MIWVTLIGGLARILTRLAWVWVHWTQRLAQSLCRGTVEARGNQTHGRGVFQVPEQPSHRLPEEFGGNEWLVDELYERYQQDKNTVDSKWWPLFESFEASDASPANGTSGTATAVHPATRELPVVAPAAAPAAPAPAAPAATRRARAARRTGCARRQESPGHRRPGRLQDFRRRPRHRADPGAAAQEPQGPDGSRRRRRLGPARPGQGDRLEHGHQPGSADRHERARHPGEAADRQPRGHQLQPGPRPRRQGLLHAPDRLRRHPRPVPVPVDERLLRRDRRQAGGCPAGARELRHRDRHAQARRHPPAHGPEHQEGGDPQLLRVLAHLRGPDQACPQRQADRGRPLRHHRVPDQPRRHRHRPLGPAPVQGPGRHHRRRRTGLPGRVPGCQREDHRAERDQQGPHADLHL